MFFFFFNDTATTEIYTLSLHDALPICSRPDEHDVATGAAEIEKRLESLGVGWRGHPTKRLRILVAQWGALADRKSTRLNSSHSQISYAVFCLKKKKKHDGNAQAVCQRE